MAKYTVTIYEVTPLTFELESDLGSPEGVEGFVNDGTDEQYNAWLGMAERGKPYISDTMAFVSGPRL